MEGSDEELAAQSKAGSTAAFESLVRRYQPRLLRFLEKQVGDREDARDITQRSLLQAYAGIARYNPDRPFAPWLFHIARCEGIDFLRHIRARRSLHERFGEEDLCQPDSNPADRLDEEERVGKRWRWIRSRLDARSFEILWLHIQEEMEIRDIARVVGLTRGHVKVLLFRSRTCLRRHFDSEKPPLFTEPNRLTGSQIPQPDILKT